MVIIMDTDAAWERFQKSDTAFTKASVDGKLDTIAAQLQEISTDMSRVISVVPKIMGDESAIENAPPEEEDDEDPLAMFLDEGGDESEDMPPQEEDMGAPEEEPDMGGEGPDTGEEPDMEEEEPVTKAEDEDDDMDEEAEMESEEPPVEEVSEEISEGPEEISGEPVEGAPAEEEAPEEVSEEVDIVPEEEPVEAIEPAGQEGLPPEGVPDLTDEINADQPDGLLNIYDRFVEGMKAAAHQAVESGHMSQVGNLAGAQNAIDVIWKSQIAPVMDQMNGDDRFTKSCETPKRFIKSERDAMNGKLMSDEIASSHEVTPEKCSDEGSENGSGTPAPGSAPDAPEGTIPEKGAPHALNNEPEHIAKSCEDGEPVEKSCDGESVEKSASPPDDGQGMTPIEKSEGAATAGIEGYSNEKYSDGEEDVQLPYADPIKKSMPSFKEVMAQPEEDRFMMMAELRHGPHMSSEQFMKSWYGDIEPVAKSMTAGEEPEGTTPFEGSIEKSDEPNGDIAPAGDGAIEKSTGQQIDEVNGAFEKTDTGITDVGEELQGPVDEKSASTGLDCVEHSMKKSEDNPNGKPIATFKDMMAFRKSMDTPVSRPGSEATVNGNKGRPESNVVDYMGSIKKSMDGSDRREKVRMGYGVDPRKVVESDWAEYRLYKDRNSFN